VRHEGNNHDPALHATLIPNEAEALHPDEADPRPQKGSNEEYQLAAILLALHEAEAHQDHLVEAQYVAVVEQVRHLVAVVEATVPALVAAIVAAEAEATAIIVAADLL
jgi:hypothetical protein